MKIAIVTLGTRGDLQPFIALGLGLQRAGYDVLLISSKNETEFVRGYGLPYHALNVDVQQAMENQAVQQMAKGDNPLSFILSHLSGNDSMKQTMIDVQDEIWEACQGADTLIYHPGMSNVYLMAQELGIPSILASPFPLSTKGDYPSILFYDGPRLGKLYNRLTHFIFENAFWQLSRSSAKAFWKKRGKANLVPMTPPSRLQAASGMPTLYGYSEQLFARPHDWPGNLVVTGSWSLPDDPTWTPPADLVNFLQAGEPPVYVGFGSIKDAGTFSETSKIIVSALTKAKRRGLIALGWNLPDALDPLPDSVFVLGSAPHSWLFPRMAAVVHHGGAGTTHAGLNAGRPTLIIPHTADQPAWGRRVYELGAGAAPIPRKKLTADNLAAALPVLFNPDVRAKAAELGSLMAEENGIREAVAQIDTYLKTTLARKAHLPS
ncbi:glycosyltransferase [Fibrella aquatilis]|uniref:Glycosyltransferase family 1 protein n=1 Tax=Fibrella aquatilis TaxID=2817059 RepID=A0A939K001_9BACT|nr:glycosyltransferase [Fibrella aquatilis]MBO0931958.1 glycosyltransferase family 1 protein [Fibrella aquatilis]